MYASFHLQKWYLDVVDDDGQVFIGYWAKLQWGLLSLHYHGYLHKRHGKPVSHSNGFRQIPAPAVKGDRLDWQVSHISGVWQRRTPSINKSLLKNEHGSVEWSAVMPSAAVTVEWQDGSTLAGFGYVERLEMTIPPWRLPIQRLYWGRAMNDTETVVWIRWVSNTFPITHVFHSITGQGTEDYSCDLQIDKDKVAFGDYYLTLQKPEELRSGIIRETVFQQLGCLKWIFPRSIQQLQETKWLSRGYLAFQHNTSECWVIHEVVDWS